MLLSGGDTQKTSVDPVFVFAGHNADPRVSRKLRTSHCAPLRCHERAETRTPTSRSSAPSRKPSPIVSRTAQVLTSAIFLL